MTDLFQRISLSYDLAINGWYKEAVAYLVPERVFVAIFNWRFAENARLSHTSDGWWINAIDIDLSIALPRAMTAVRFSQKDIAAQLETVRDKYQLEGFVEIEEKDTVVDIGAFIGEFTMATVDHVDSILAFEPDPVNYAALARTTEKNEKITVRNDLLWCQKEELLFSVATDGSESSVSNPDRGASSYRERKTAIRFDSAVSTPIDFAKVEAEGAEAEVLEGFGEAAVGKIAVDCSEAGSEGETPEHRIQALLDERGYDTKIVDKEIHGTMLFARKRAE